MHETFQVRRFMQIVMMTDDADHLGAHVGIDQQELPESLMPRHIPMSISAWRKLTFLLRR
jgi:hypothetical protein